MTGFDDEQIDSMIAAQEAGEYPPDTAQDWQPEPDYDDGPDEYSVYMAMREDRLAQRLDLSLPGNVSWAKAYARGLVSEREWFFYKGQITNNPRSWRGMLLALTGV